MFSLVSCGEEKAPVSMYDLRVAMLKADDSMPEMLSVSSSDTDCEESFDYLSDMDYSKVESFFLAYSADGSAYEIAVICLKTEADVSECKTSLESHRDSRVRTYENYLPNDAKQAKDTEIVSNGRYVAFIMCKDTKSVKNAFCDFTD